ncbi:hypothetical protein SDC9_148842 [bioreactor metagenome]|uniref:Uncharacterized protein n=1 Tax=bioreactor metagenome TaxID=1076179 RepID=A0A645EK25_9ZZZZ
MKNAAEYTIDSTVSLYTPDDNSFAAATLLTGDQTVNGTVVKKGDAADYYDLSDFAEGKLEWTQLSGSVKVTFYDENYNQVKVTVSLAKTGGTSTTGTGSSFTLSSSSLSSLLLELADSGAAYLKVEASGSGNNAYRFATSETVSAVSSYLASSLSFVSTDLSAALAATGDVSTSSLLSATDTGDSETALTAMTTALSASYDLSVASSLTEKTDENNILRAGTLLA